MRKRKATPGPSDYLTYIRRDQAHWVRFRTTLPEDRPGDRPGTSYTFGPIIEAVALALREALAADERFIDVEAYSKRTVEVVVAGLLEGDK